MNTENFTESELSCKCCGEYEANAAILIILEDLRRHFKKPVNVNCSTRCKKHNAEVGGKDGSYHLTGHAADIHIKGVTPYEVHNYLDNCAYSNVIGLGLYDVFVHVDSRGYKARW